MSERTAIYAKQRFPSEDTKRPSRFSPAVLFLVGSLGSIVVWLVILIAANTSEPPMSKAEVLYFSSPIFGGIFVGGAAGCLAVLLAWRELSRHSGRLFGAAALASGILFPLVSPWLSAWAPGFLSLYSPSFSLSVTFYVALLAAESAALCTLVFAAALCLNKLRESR